MLLIPDEPSVEEAKNMIKQILRRDEGTFSWMDGLKEVGLWTGPRWQRY